MQSTELAERLREAEGPQGLGTMSPEEVYSALGTSAQGLNAVEARERLAQYGPNVIQETKKRPLILRLLSNLTNLFAILLWIGAVLAYVARLPQLSVAIVAVILINGAFSFWQEFKAERAIDALRKLLPTYARVLRDGEEQRIPAQELVPGDVVLLSEGDAISADGRLVQEFELRTNNTSLTGESVPVRRNAEPSIRQDMAYTDQPNFVYAGTSVATGSGRAVVSATGMGTAFGRIAELTQAVEAGESPLQIEVARVIRIISVVAVGVGVLFFALATLLTDTTLLESFVFAIGIIVAFIPEGMLPLVTLTLAVGVQRMARRHALIKKLSAVETLGSTTVICTDKTGTLTQNEMTVRAIWLPEGEVHVDGRGYEPSGRFAREGQPIEPRGHAALERFLRSAALASNARLLPPDEATPRWSVLGDPTEGALIVAATSFGLPATDLNASEPRRRELPFESGRKRMSTINERDGELFANVKGAPSEVLRVSTRIAVGEGTEPLNERWQREIIAKNDEYARQALRVLAVAYRAVQRNEDLSDTAVVERDLIFLGLVAMYDPPRAEVAAAVKHAQEAQIRIVMITGDYGLTAEAIARRVGLVRGEHVRVITGHELDDMSDEDLRRVLSGEEVIFARVTPEHKLRVVSAFKDMGQIVAVTGDGVNDAPALKRADIGIAMGITGTDVAKEAAVMILTDDNFASIVSAIEEGRGVYANVKRFITYIFTSNTAEAVPFILFVLSGGAIPLALTVIQILLVDLGTDILPALGLGVEQPEPGVMQRPPRSQSAHLIDGPLLLRAFIWLGGLAAVAAMASFFAFYWTNGYCCRLAPLPGPAQIGQFYIAATTVTFAAIVAAQVGNVYAVRTDRSSTLSIGLFSNRYINIGVAAEILLLVSIVYVPFLQRLLGTAAFPAPYWLMLLPIPVLFFGLEELRKCIVRRRRRPAASPPQETLT
ncbi:MAG: cation-translocating P-type ATPase [Anaerolineae bacterium]